MTEITDEAAELDRLADQQTDPVYKRIYKNMAERERNKEYQLAFWADPQRGIPNEFARSALFAAVPPNKAKYVERDTVFSQQGFSITYTGKQLTQSDLDVFEGVMHLARGMHEGNKLRFKARQLLRTLGKGTGKSQYEWLLTVLQRLTATAVAIERDSNNVYWGSLLPEGAAKLDNGEFVVHLNRQLIKLFDRGFTPVQWEQRLQLKKKPLAQHLHAWICSHEKPYPVTVDYLRQISGSETNKLYHFRAALKKALDEIKTVGAISGWHIDNTDKVHLTKTSATVSLPK